MTLTRATNECCTWCRGGSHLTKHGCICACHDPRAPLHYLIRRQKAAS